MSEGALTLAGSRLKRARTGRNRVDGVCGHSPGTVLPCGGLVVITAMIAAAIFAPLVATHDPNKVDLLAAAQGPSRDHWLGTDDIGRDVFSRLVYGARVSLSVGIVAVAIYVAHRHGAGIDFGISSEDLSIQLFSE